jgi:hypothetical protein
MSPVPMRDRVAIGQRWRRRRDKQLARIRQIHRADRLAELQLIESPAPAKTVLFVDFSELRSRWQPLDEPPTPPNADARSRR